VGGDAVALERARPVLDTFGGLVVHLGPLGSGLDTKLALNLLRYLTLSATREAQALLQAAGVRAPFEQIVDYTGALEMPGRPRGGPPPNPLIPEDVRDAARIENNAATARKDLRAAVARGSDLGVVLATANRAIETVHVIWDASAPADSAVD
jgi:3-hydroxyisobutyrate dehydrogenase-like beta-hydroxyacid dehydrogenase